MTLKRLVIILGTLVVLAGVGIMWLWQYAYSPQGRARVIIAQLKGDTTSLRGWMLNHHLVRPGFTERTSCEGEAHGNYKIEDALGETVKLGHTVLPIVIAALKDENSDVQEMAIRACGEFHDPVAGQPLVDCMRESYSTQKLCVDSLVEISPDACSPLMKACKGIGSPRELDIPDKLRKRWGTAAVPQLIEFLDDSDRATCQSAAGELGKLKDKRAVDALLRHLSDSEPAVGAASAWALGSIGDPKAIPSLLRALNDQHIKNVVHISVAGVLSQMGRSEGFRFLLATLKYPNRDDRACAVVVLGLTQVKESLEPLLSMLSDNDKSVRYWTVWALGELHDTQAIPAIRELLNDPDLTVRENAASALEDLRAKPPPASQPDKP